MNHFCKYASLCSSPLHYYLEDLFLPTQEILGKVIVVPGEGAQPRFSPQCDKVNSTLTFPSASNWHICLSNHFMVDINF